jgi:arginine deiminase
MKVVIICRPNDYAVTHANNNYNNNLFRTEVDINKMNNNYECLKSVMNKHMIKYIDLTEYMPDGRNYLDFANMLFVRDTFISTKKGIIIGNMKEKVRKYETQIIKYILQNRLFLNIMYECEEDEILEGGDFIHNDNTSFIAACTRTNMKAVKKLLEKDMFGTDKVVVIYTKNKDTDMYRIHLDCYFGLFNNNNCLLWDELIDKKSDVERYVVEYTRKDGNYVKTSFRNTTLYEYLINNNYNVIPISTNSQKHYGCNILDHPNGVVLVQDNESFSKISNSIMVNFDEIHNMYGGIHCATNTINI